MAPLIIKDPLWISRLMPALWLKMNPEYCIQPLFRDLYDTSETWAHWKQFWKYRVLPQYLPDKMAVKFIHWGRPWKQWPRPCFSSGWLVCCWIDERRDLWRYLSQLIPQMFLGLSGVSPLNWLFVAFPLWSSGWVNNENALSINEVATIGMSLLWHVVRSTVWYACRRDHSGQQKAFVDIQVGISIWLQGGNSIAKMRRRKVRPMYSRKPILKRTPVWTFLVWRHLQYWNLG